MQVAVVWKIGHSFGFEWTKVDKKISQNASYKGRNKLNIYYSEDA